MAGSCDKMTASTNLPVAMIAPALASHWQYLLSPMAAQDTEQAAPLRFRQLEYYRR